MCSQERIGTKVMRLRPVSWSLMQPSIFRVYAECDVENTASARVLEKVGMSRERILRKWIMHPNVSDGLRDCLRYAIVKEQRSFLSNES